MKLSIGTNFDNKLLDMIQGTDVEVLYGKMSSDIIGGGRATFALPKINKEKVEQHVKYIHQKGLKFNYLLNATCLDNLETTREFNIKLQSLLEWLGSMKVDYITLTLPMLIDRVREVLPDVKISLSTFANVSTIRQAKYYEDRGVYEITLPESKNRDFKFLEQLKKHTNCNYQLIATNDCLINCPLRHSHSNFQSHASQCQHITQGFALDYCMLRCTQQKIIKPEELLKSPWIRPEDLKIYEDLGYDKIKLTERMKITTKIADTAKAYSNRNYNGNLLSLLNSRISEDDFEIPDFSINANDKFVPQTNMAKFYKLLFSLKATIDNKKLDGFIEGFKTKNCSISDCEQCGYCKSWAKKVIKIDHNVDEKLKEFENIFNELATGEFFNINNNDQVIWSEQSKEILNKFIDLKPDSIKSLAESQIKQKAEELAAERGGNEVLPDDVAKANLLSTPEEFRMFAENDLKTLGFDLLNFGGKE